MKFPLAFLLTWTTYGTWLHGDERGSFNAYGNFIPATSILRAKAVAAMSEDAVILTDEQRKIVDARLLELCCLAGWCLHARNVRTNHVHAVVSASLAGEALRSRLKAGCSMSLSEHAGLVIAGKNGARKWWTQKGNIVEIWSERHLEEEIKYVNEGQ